MLPASAGGSDALKKLPSSAGMISSSRPGASQERTNTIDVPFIRTDDPQGHRTDALSVHKGESRRPEMDEDFMRKMASEDSACTRHENNPQDLIDGYASRHPIPQE